MHHLHDVLVQHQKNDAMNVMAFVDFFYSGIFYNPGPLSFHFRLYSKFSTSEIFGAHCLEDLL